MILEIHDDERKAIQKVVSEATWASADDRAASALAEFARLDEHEENAIGSFLRKLRQAKISDRAVPVPILLVLATATRDEQFANAMCSCDKRVPLGQARPGQHHHTDCVLFTGREESTT